MNTTDETTGSINVALQDHLEVCSKLLALAQKEAAALKSATPFPAATIQAERRVLLSRLESALQLLGQKQLLWQQLGPERRARSAQVNPLIQTALDTIMRILVLDRENEQALLRRGLLPVRSLPPVEQSHPHCVARLYQHHAKA
jgi:hypothetical protein